MVRGMYVSALAPRTAVELPGYPDTDKHILVCLTGEAFEDARGGHASISSILIHTCPMCRRKGPTFSSFPAAERGVGSWRKPAIMQATRQLLVRFDSHNACAIVPRVPFLCGQSDNQNACALSDVQAVPNGEVAVIHFAYRVPYAYITLTVYATQFNSDQYPKYFI